MTRVIITRAEPGQSQTASHVTALGLTPIRAPMLHLEPCDVPMPPLADYGALLLTSANSVRFFSDRTLGTVRDLNLTAYCVGPATLDAARKAGLSDCQHADGNALDLAALVTAHRAPSQGKLLHIANAAAAGDLAETLRKSGFHVDFLPLYAARPETTPHPEVTACLAAAAPAIVLIHSAKAAEAFAALYTFPPENRHGLVAVSEKAARPLAHAGFQTTAIAARPNETALMACLSSAQTTL